jgi:predicted ATP-grasp superfamily ATP-dependent carboligase
MKQPKAIIIGSADVIKLCVIRAVGLFGCDVDVVHLGKKSKFISPVDYYSKYVNHYYYSSKDNLIQFLLNNYSRHDAKPTIFTLDDYTTYLIDEAREKLNSSFLFAHLNSDGSLADLMNKHLLKTKAIEAGMNAVKGWPISFENGNFQIPDGIKFPCFVKGLQSFYVSKTVQSRCDSYEELQNLLERCKKKYPYPVYAEEFIAIDKDFGIIGVSDGSKCIIPAKVELLEMGKGSTNGVSMLGRVSPLENIELCKQIEKLLEKLHYVGIFNIDFVESNGKIYFVELNFRFAAYGYGVFRAGCNLPAIFINTLNGCGIGLLQKAIVGSYYYLNEKIGLTNVIEKSININKYRTLKKKADFTLVKDKEDSKPYCLLIFKYLLGYIKSMINR